MQSNKVKAEAVLVKDGCRGVKEATSTGVKRD